MSEHVLVIGAGIGGLCAALSLQPTGRQITLLERDLAPPSTDPDVTFLDWHRRGAGHVRQSHAFLARLRGIIKANHPELLEKLISLGVRELTFEMMLTPLQREGYQPAPEDSELTIVTSRRTTLELAIRTYVEQLPGVAIKTGVTVKRLLTRNQGDGPVDVFGVQAETAAGLEDLAADMIVDSTGKSGFTLPQLMQDGAKIKEEGESAGILYFTRHYRLRPGQDEPDRTKNPPGSGDLGYLKFGVFPGDNGCFSITIAVPEIEFELRKAIVDPDKFHAITLQLPGLEPWTNAERAEPRGKVYGMGNLVSRWRDMVIDKAPAVLNYFAMGDTLVRTNPLYGRGCSFAAVSAEMLRETLEETGDATARQLAYHKRIHRELRPLYLNQRSQDRAAIKRAKAALTPGFKRSWKANLARSFFEDGVAIAVRKDVHLLRQALRGFHMLEHPSKWLGRPGNLAKVLYIWALGKKHNAEAYPPKPGPKRDAMMNALAIDHTADLRPAADPEAPTAKAA